MSNLSMAMSGIWTRRLRVPTQKQAMFFVLLVDRVPGFFLAHVYPSGGTSVRWHPSGNSDAMLRDEGFVAANRSDVTNEQIRAACDVTMTLLCHGFLALIAAPLPGIIDMVTRKVEDKPIAEPRIIGAPAADGTPPEKLPIAEMVVERACERCKTVTPEHRMRPIRTAQGVSWLCAPCFVE